MTQRKRVVPDLLLEKFLGLFSSTVYMTFSPDEVKGWDIHWDTPFTCAPLTAIKKGRVVAAGAEAERQSQDQPDPAIEFVNPFNHPRVIISDVDAAFALFRHVLVKAINRKTLIRPRVIVHPLQAESIAGGLTQVELRVLREASLSAGAREIFIWTGPELTREQIKTLSFPPEGKVLRRY